MRAAAGAGPPLTHSGDETAPPPLPPPPAMPLPMPAPAPVGSSTIDVPPLTRPVQPRPAPAAASARVATRVVMEREEAREHARRRGSNIMHRSGTRSRSKPFKRTVTDSAPRRVAPPTLGTVARSALVGDLRAHLVRHRRRSMRAGGTRTERLDEPREYLAGARTDAYLGELVGAGRPVVDERDGQAELVRAAREPEARVNGQRRADD